MNDTIRVTAAQVRTSLAFQGSTALAGCTHYNYTDAGTAIVRNWPNLSAGETLLWRVLDWVNGGDDLPTLKELRAGLDADNYAVCADLLRTVAA